MKNTRKILFSAALLSSGLTMAQTTTAEKSPNVIYIMADDLGIGDLGCYGQRQIKTPNIDGIAQNGMKFMQHYSGSTVSAPSRCALITGKHMGHAAIRGNAKVAGSDGLLYETPLPAGEVTVADIFKTKNYVTGCVGKWGMGGPGTEGMPANMVLIISTVIWGNVLLIVITLSFCMRMSRRLCWMGNIIRMT